MIDHAILDAMVESGCTAEQIAAVVKASTSKRSTGAERQARYRARKVAGSVTSDVTSVTVTDNTPVPPFSDKEKSPTPPKEINSSPLTPQTTLLSASAEDDFDILASKIDAAANGKIHPASLIVIGPIVEMIATGVSLEMDILPAVKATAARSGKSFPLSYHLPAIRQAYERRIGASAGLPKVKQIEKTEAAWAKSLRFARERKLWSTPELGPMPGLPGCRVPKNLVAAGDGEGWVEVSHDRRAA